MSPRCEIVLLGEFRGKNGLGEPFKISPSRMGYLFACLTLRPNYAFSREHLAGLLWPDTEPSAARTRLRQEIRALRRLLEPDGISEGSVLGGDRETLSLHSEAVLLDVEQFRSALDAAEQTREPLEKVRLFSIAVSLYGGELLPTFDLPQIDQERQQLVRRFEIALRGLAGAQQEIGNLKEAEETFHRLIALNPYLEEAHAGLIQLYMMTERASQAHSQYRELERLLQNEFAIAPSDTTRRLLDDIPKKSTAPTPQPLSVTDTPQNGNGSHKNFDASPAPQIIISENPPVSLPSAHPRPYLPAKIRVLGASLLVLLLCSIAFVRWRSVPKQKAIEQTPKPPQDAVAVTGQELWVTQFLPKPGEKINAQAKAMCLDPQENICVTGLIATHQADAAILTFKVDKEKGKILWWDRYASPEHDCDRGFSVVADREGNVYVGEHTYVPGSRKVHEGWRLVLIKYSSNGKRLWVERSKEIVVNNDKVRVASDKSGGVYLGGTQAEPGKPRALLVFHYDGAKHLIWKHSFQADSKQDTEFADFASNDEALFVCGTAKQGRQKYGGREDWVTLRFDKNGERQWVKSFDGPASKTDTALKIGVDHNGMVYVNGDITLKESIHKGSQKTMAFVTYRADDGDKRWERWLEPQRFPLVSRCISSDTLYIAFAGTTQTSDESWAILGVYDTQGNLLWTRQFPFPSSPEGISIGYGGVTLLYSGSVNSTGQGVSTAFFNSNGTMNQLRNWPPQKTPPNLAFALVQDSVGNAYVTAQGETPHDGGSLFIYKYPPLGKL